MIRGVEFRINPAKMCGEEASIGSKSQGSEWRHSIHYLDKSGSLFKAVSKLCKLVDQISRFAPLKPIAGSIGMVARRLGQASELANIYTTTESFSEFVQSKKVGLNLETAKEVLTIADMGLDLVYWFSVVDKLGITVRAASKLTSMSLGLAILSPTIDLIRLLKSEGLEALEGPKLYKSSYKLGLSLLSIYVFMTAATLSTYLSVAIASIDFAMACPDYFNQAYELCSSVILKDVLQSWNDY